MVYITSILIWDNNENKINFCHKLIMKPSIIFKNLRPSIKKIIRDKWSGSFMEVSYIIIYYTN